MAVLDEQRDIMVADDDPEVIQLVRDIFADAGWVVRSAPDGAEALKMVRANPPDLLLLDLHLPDMDGFEVFQQLRRDGDGGGFPIILLTAVDAHDAVRQGFELGAVDYMTKPFAPAQLRSRIETWLLRSRS